MNKTDKDGKAVTDSGTAPSVRQFNSIETYSDAGRRAGQAMNRNDFALMQHHTAWFRKASALEAKHYAAEAKRAFDAAYRTERGI